MSFLTPVPQQIYWRVPGSPTGSVPRTVASKLNQTVSVRDFGAKLDGTTDDTNAINAALTYINGTGKTLIFDGASCLVTAPLLMNPVSNAVIDFQECAVSFVPTLQTYLFFAGPSPCTDLVMRGGVFTTAAGATTWGIFNGFSAGSLTQNITFDNIRTSGFVTALDLRTFVSIVTVTDCNFGANTTAIKLTGNVTRVTVDDDTVLTTTPGTSTVSINASGGVSPSGIKLPEHILAYGAVMDGSTDDTNAIKACISAALALGFTVVFPSAKSPAYVTGSIDVSGVSIEGRGYFAKHIQASAVQFDVLTTTGATRIDGLYVHGGWDGATAGLSGDLLSIKAVAPSFPYNVHIKDCVFQYAKKRGIYWERGGYSSAFNVKVNACGLHAIELFGNNGADATTTVAVDGFSVFSDCPNGYGVKLTEVINVSFDNCIAENTSGIKIAGVSNRAIRIQSFYQENTTGGKFVDWAGSSGAGFEVTNCFGGGASIDYNANWAVQNYGGNTNLGEPAIPIDSNQIILVDGGEQTTAAAGSYTAATIALPPGTWLLKSYVQTINSAGATITQLGATLTTNNAASGLNIATNVANFGSDEQTFNPGATADLRVLPDDVVLNTTGANVNYYLRTYINVTAGTVAYRGMIKAIRIH